LLDDRELQAVEAAVGKACASRDPRGLRQLGYGEISIVLGWPADAPAVAVKRLPPFSDQAAFDAYASVVSSYVDRLRSAGVAVLPTEVRSVVRPDGRVAGFHVQPMVPPGAIATDVLRGTVPAADHPVVTGVADAVSRATADGVGVDAQLANWAVLDGVPHQLDLTTPFLTRPDGRLAFDTGPFLASLPAPLRPIVDREMQSLVRRWLSARGSLLDLVANLYKEGLDPWVAPVLGVVNRRVGPPITAAEALRIHHQDRRLWPLLLRLQKSERWWRTTVRRRGYEFLLPERTTYGR
jgi:Family of unknown function (DUF6206)